MNRRNQILNSLHESEYDLVVTGGGLLGAGIALEAASDGFSVLLADKDDFAAGASSRTSKIAGAPDYVGGGNPFSMKPGSSKTKTISELYQTAPHMVKDFAFLMPIASNRMLFSVKAQLGLAIQDVQGNVLGKARGHKRLSKKDALRAVPALAPAVVAGGLSFHDCFYDDSRYTLELLKAASGKGAITVNYLEARSFESQDGDVRSVVLRDRIEGQEFTVRAKAFVSACGAWSANLAGMAGPIEDTHLGFKKFRTTHIILPPSALEVGGALLLPAEEGRYVFIVPWQRALLVGSSRQVTEDGPENPVPTAEDINYLLDWINRYKRPGRKVTGADIACAWSGFDIETDELNGEPSVYRGPNGMFMAYGCHLRDLKKTAKKALHFITNKIGPRNNEAPPAPTMLGGFVDKQDYLLTTAQIAARARKLSVDPASLDHLVTNYGKDALLVLDLIEQNPALNERICPDFPPLMAEVEHCVNNEMAVSLEDVLCRRIRLGFLHREQCLDAAPRVSRMMQELCGWDSLRLKGELGNLARNLASQLAPVS
ncbi:MAG: FAD-dependent oxidoreductase [Cyanobacteria bacterium SZAS LIN-3]|nr:FAD-dependent oxidoreductase [Cyanobacteria bacterium SZAS LIN-3]